MQNVTKGSSYATESVLEKKKDSLQKKPHSLRIKNLFCIITKWIKSISGKIWCWSTTHFFFRHIIHHKNVSRSLSSSFFFIFLFSFEKCSCFKWKYFLCFGIDERKNTKNYKDKIQLVYETNSNFIGPGQIWNIIKTNICWMSFWNI